MSPVRRECMEVSHPHMYSQNVGTTPTIRRLLMEWRASLITDGFYAMTQWMSEGVVVGMRCYLGLGMNKTLITPLPNNTLLLVI